MDTRTFDAMRQDPCQKCGAVAPHCHIPQRDVRDVIRDALSSEQCLLSRVRNALTAIGTHPEDSDRLAIESALRDLERATDWLDSITPTSVPSWHLDRITGSYLDGTLWSTTEDPTSL